MFTRTKLVFGTLLFFALHGAAFSAAGMHAQDLMFHPMDQGGGHQHGQPSGGRRGKLYMLMNGEDSTMKMWKPDGTPVDVDFSGDHFYLPKSGVDNYHAVGVELRRSCWR